MIILKCDSSLSRVKIVKPAAMHAFEKSQPRTQGILPPWVGAISKGLLYEVKETSTKARVEHIGFNCLDSGPAIVYITNKFHQVVNINFVCNFSNINVLIHSCMHA